MHSSTSSRHTQPATDGLSAYLLASLKRTKKGDRYITFWRPERSGYAWSIPWAGRYDLDEALLCSDLSTAIYKDTHSYAVPVSVIEPLCVAPRPGDIDGNVGPVLRNTKAHWALIEAHNDMLRATTASSVGTAERSEDVNQ